MKKLKTDKTTATVNSQAPTATSIKPERGNTPKISLQTNWVSEYVLCGICGDPYMTGPFDFFTEDTSSPVCKKCVAEVAPDLLPAQEAAFGFATETLGDYLYGSIVELKESLDKIYGFAVLGKEQVTERESVGIGRHGFGVIVSMLDNLRNSIDRSMKDVRRNAGDMVRRPMVISDDYEALLISMNGEDKGRGAPEMRP